jgi:ankyrin repeat protein
VNKASILIIISLISIISCSSITNDEKDLLQGAREGNLELVKKALKNGADINVMNESVTNIVKMNSHPPIYLAAVSGHLNVVKYLALQGASLKSRSGHMDEESLLMGAARAGQLKVVKYLIAKGADLNYNSRFNTVLMKTAMFGQLETVKFLVAKGADVNQTNLFGDTVLMRAVQSGNIEIVKYLIKKGVDVNVNSHGQTALSIAKKKNYAKITEFLKKHGAKELQVKKPKK